MRWLLVVSVLAASAGPAHASDEASVGIRAVVLKRAPGLGCENGRPPQCDHLVGTGDLAWSVSVTTEVDGVTQTCTSVVTDDGALDLADGESVVELHLEPLLGE